MEDQTKGRLSFPDSWFEDEVRSGFYVPGMMKRAWAAQMEVLMEIDHVCKKHGIVYYADAGTLLGAVRHGGFVPWDDEIDICMMREDYDWFNRIAQEELPKGYRVLNIHTDPDCEDMLSRVINCVGFSFQEGHLQKYHGFPFECGVDIFPLDDMLTDTEEERSRDVAIRYITGIASQAGSGGCEGLEEHLRRIEKLCGASIDRTGNLKNQLYLQAERFFAMGNGKGSGECALLTSWLSYGSNRFQKEWYQSVVMLPFENTNLPVPAVYDAILKQKYGDYMKNVRGTALHEYPCYDRLRRRLLDETGVALEPQYVFSPEDLQREKPIRQTIKDQAREVLDLMGRIQAMIRDASERSDLAAAGELLELCQNYAVSLGNGIEQSQGEGFVTVSMLEEYCEQVWRLHEILVQGKEGKPQRVFRGLEELLGRIASSVEHDIKIRKEIVFLPFKASAWNCLASVWKAAVSDPDCDVYVAPIPYYGKDLEGNLKELHYEGLEFPKDVPVIWYQDYDFEKRRPDVIVIQNPYDEYNFATSVLPFFYSKNLKTYTDQLIYIPWFTLSENHIDGEYAIQNMEYFVNVPGVVHADRVIVQSENMRKAYVNCLSKFAGEDTRCIWEEKILGLGSPEYDRTGNVGKEDLQLSETWQNVMKKADGSWKKVIVYHTSVSTFLQYKKRAIQKLEQVLWVFEESRDEVALIWKPDVMMGERKSFMEPHLWEEYQRIVGRYQADGWGIYDDLADERLVLELSDAYYGDAGSLMQCFVEIKKPVMLQNI